MAIWIALKNFANLGLKAGYFYLMYQNSQGSMYDFTKPHKYPGSNSRCCPNLGVQQSDISYSTMCEIPLLDCLPNQSINFEAFIQFFYTMQAKFPQRLNKGFLKML
jgi:hypothetical protein